MANPFMCSIEEKLAHENKLLDFYRRYIEWIQNRIEPVDSPINRSDEGLTLETSAFLSFTVANLRFQPSC